ncbi:hypothetical protein ABKN59_000134 [Abortiporus biennis]
MTSSDSLKRSSIREGHVSPYNFHKITPDPNGTRTSTTNSTTWPSTIVPPGNASCHKSEVIRDLSMDTDQYKAGSSFDLKIYH